VKNFRSKEILFCIPATIIPKSNKNVMINEKYIPVLLLVFLSRSG
jgi:hypothetical protein